MFCTRKQHCAVGHFYFKTKLIEKEIRFEILKGRAWQEGKLVESGQEVETSSYKINKY